MEQMPIWKICNYEEFFYVKFIRQGTISIPFVHIMYVIKARTHVSVREMTVKRTRLVLLDCTTGKAGRAIQ